MYTAEQIKTLIAPIPQQVTMPDGEGLTLTGNSKFCFSAPAVKKGPAKTAADDMCAFLSAKCGEDCFAPDGIPVTLTLDTAPAGVKNETEAYRIRISAEGISITGFGESGLFYGVGSFKQLCRWDNRGATLPAVEVLDWPDNPYRAYKEECRYGSNMMERQDWFELIDDLTSKKLNRLSLGLYGCWTVQYDGRVSEYLYLPLKHYPQLQTPMTVKYYSPTEKKWFNYEQLPPIFRDNLMGDIVRYAKDRGMDVIPGINSFGHNTLFPRMLPEVAPVNDEGVKQPTGFCTSSEETYKLLFSAYDQIIDEYLLPNEIYSFNILLDEVWEQYGVDPDDMYAQKTPWCRCEKCRDKSRGELYIEHAIRCIKHLKEKGMKSIMMANDMVARKVSKLGDLSQTFLDRVKEEGLEDVLFFGWWWYHDMKEKLDFVREPDELGLRSFFSPWTGYFIWSLLTSPLKNIQIMAEMNHNAKCGEGMQAYSMWDRSYDRVHDCLADYAWNYEGTGDTEDVTDRYVARHFAPLQDKVRYAYRLIDWITEERKESRNPEDPTQKILCSYNVLRQLSYYPHCYFANGKVYPKHFPGNGFAMLLSHRKETERILFATASMGKEALEIFEEAAKTPGCDQEMARRMAYECHNYVVLAQDWIAFFQMLDIKDQKKIAPMARQRQKARLELMERCEQTKENWVCKAATMRNHSVFMQTFADIAEYIESTDDPKLDLMDITTITSPELRNLR